MKWSFNVSLVLSLCCFCLLTACFKGDIMPLQITTSTANPVTTTPAQGSTPGIVRSGSFVPTSGISVSGSVKILRDSAREWLLLDSFHVTPGPDLKVYLAKEYPAVSFINLGALKNTGSDQTYLIPVQVDFSVYKYVLIHCQQYNHLFAYALIQ